MALPSDRPAVRFVHPDFAAVGAILEDIVTGRRGRGGGAVAVYHQGELVVDTWAGQRDREGAPWEHDTMALSFSTTKGVVATLAHRLVDRGLLHHDLPVARWWPEFAAAGKAGITLRHLLAHRAAMHRVRGLVDSAWDLTDWDAMVARFEQAAPAWEPGLRSGYHGLSYGWLVGEVIRRVTDSSVDAALQRELVVPLGLDGAHIGAPPSVRHRVAELELRGRDPERIFRLAERFAGRDAIRPFHDALVVPEFLELAFSHAALDAEIPAANGVFTARSLARIYAALVTPDAVDGPRLVSAETTRRASEVQGFERDAVVGFPMRWRLGYHLAATRSGTLPAGFGHFGYGGSGAWGDPETGLAIGFVTNQVAGTPFGDTRLLRLGSAAVRAARGRSSQGAAA